MLFLGAGRKCVSVVMTGSPPPTHHTHSYLSQLDNVSFDLFTIFICFYFSISIFSIDGFLHSVYAAHLVSNLRNFSRYWCYYNKRLNIYHRNVCRNDSWISDCVCLQSVSLECFCCGTLHIYTHKHSSEWFWMWQSCERRFLALNMLYAIADDLCAHKCRLAMQILFMKTNHKKFNKKRLGADFKYHTNHNNEIWDKCKPKYRNQCD